jgi:pimeloyl-ACP methyl ester carboxylesterase
VDDRRPRVCLERIVELAEVRLRLRDWPGLGGPIVHIPDPLTADDSLVATLATALPRRYRLLSLEPRGTSPYQVDAADILALLDQFGFEAPVLVAEGVGCVAALLVAAWHSGRVAGLVLIEPTYDPPPSDALLARALRDCPPDWVSLRKAVECPVLVLTERTSAVDELAEFFDQLAPVVN